MFGEYTKREFALLVATLLVAGALTAWGTVFVLKKFVLAGDSNDPLTKAGGVSPAQRSIPHK